MRLVIAAALILSGCVSKPIMKVRPASPESVAKIRAAMEEINAANDGIIFYPQPTPAR